MLYGQRIKFKNKNYAQRTVQKFDILLDVTFKSVYLRQIRDTKVIYESFSKGVYLEINVCYDETEYSIRCNRQLTNVKYIYAFAYVWESCV